MALDIFYPEDVARVLGSLDVASAGTVAIVDEVVAEAARTRVPIAEAQLQERIRLYRRGYEDALHAVAVAFGVSPTYAGPGQLCLEAPRRELALTKGSIR